MLKLDTTLSGGGDKSAQIAKALAEAIHDGRLAAGERLPSEAALGAAFGVSRPTVREALKRLAAQKLVETRRGASGGAFVRARSWDEAGAEQARTAALVARMQDLPGPAAREARFALERGCAPLAARERDPTRIRALRAEIERQTDGRLDDQAFAASVARFHETLVAAAGNPLFGFCAAGAPPPAPASAGKRDRVRIVTLHQHLADALEAGDAAALERELAELEALLTRLAGNGEPEEADESDLSTPAK